MNSKITDIFSAIAATIIYVFVLEIISLFFVVAYYMDVNTLKFQNEFWFIHGILRFLLVFLFLFLAQKPILKGLFPNFQAKL